MDTHTTTRFEVHYRERDPRSLAWKPWQKRGTRTYTTLAAARKDQPTNVFTPLVKTTEFCVARVETTITRPL